ncbi:MAG: hydantoinase/oxoprolinase family protein [Thermodesulfobacteriota bacterium]
MIIGLDVGGTHTDVVLLAEDGIREAVKVPTDPTDLFHTVLSGITRVTANVDPACLQRIVLSTTLATNAVAQGRLPNVGMIVSAGPGMDPDGFRTNEHYVCVRGCIDHRGREIEPIDPNEVRQAAERFRRQDITHVGIVGKFSVRNPAHEIAIQQALPEGFDRIFLGHRVSGSLNFPRRIATTYLNAAVFPIHHAFFGAVRQSLAERGIHVPIHIMKPDGGTMLLEASVDQPAQTILSGPAASVMGSLAFAFDEEDAIVLDIGGTTTDIALLVHLAPVLNPNGITVGTYKTLIRSMESHSLALGGDSAVVIDPNGVLKIGPERKGFSLAFGGPCPTPTDALCILGKIRTGSVDRAIEGYRPIARELGCDIEQAAHRVLDTLCQTIVSEAMALLNRINEKPVYTIHEMLEGYRVHPKKILLMGGPAPFLASRIEGFAEGMQVGVVPRWDVANAIGAALARTTTEVVLFADTQQEIAIAPEEGWKEKVDRHFDKAKAIEAATAILRNKAVRLGAGKDDLETEVIEEYQFNMVRGFYTTGRNIRVRVQIKPGLIAASDAIVEMLSRG